jgi:hypothetical protein
MRRQEPKWAWPLPIPLLLLKGTRLGRTPITPASAGRASDGNSSTINGSERPSSAVFRFVRPDRSRSCPGLPELHGGRILQFTSKFRSCIVEAAESRHFLIWRN